MAPKRTSNGESKSGGAQKTQPKSSRKILITAREHQTGRLIIELRTTDDACASKYGELTALVFSEQAKSVLEAFDTLKTAVYDPQDEDALVHAISLVDACLLVPPARPRTSAGADHAEHAAHPRLCEFIELEVLAMQPKGDASSEKTGHSPCVIRAGLYAEHLLLYAKQAQGPQLTAGPELAEAASQALGTNMEFESIDEYVPPIRPLSSPNRSCLTRPAAERPRRRSSAENRVQKSTKRVSKAEREYLLEYYALLRADKTNYVATTAMLAFSGHRGQEPTEFFKTYPADFKPKKRRTPKNGGANSGVGKTTGTRGSGRGKGAAATAKAAGDEEDVEM
ncbi:hypothetical protein TRAPUB_11388 [Trametes pubescens]|uniref:Uncharacterized protein n=1 Tax=Trametes pubescens TaxID=154538 RepID=A0A1M2VWS4_TRAPU|nr:hypothetical protein TRAPUB_11388 [Trametes pubescens]